MTPTSVVLHENPKARSSASGKSRRERLRQKADGGAPVPSAAPAHDAPAAPAEAAATLAAAPGQAQTAWAEAVQVPQPPVPPAPEAPAVSLAPATAGKEALLAGAPAVQPRTTQGFEYQQPPRRAEEQKLSTGVDRLDQLLGGGYAPGCATLLYGPPFCGKQQLQQHAIVRAARDGVPVTIVLHTIGAEAMSARLAAIDPTFPAAEEAGLVRYVDVHSKALGEPTGFRHAVYVEDPHDLQALLRSIDPPRAAAGQRRPGLLVIESVSTLLIDLGAMKAFTFLRTVLGRTLTAGGVGLACLEGGMHPESEVQMAKHLCAGMVEMRKKGEAHCLHVEGLETAYARPGWIEYEFTPRSFKVTGSFASRTIR